AHQHQKRRGRVHRGGRERLRLRRARRRAPEGAHGQAAVAGSVRVDGPGVPRPGRALFPRAHVRALPGPVRGPSRPGDGMSAGLSVVLIVKDEAARLEACLASVAWADEIVVVDSGSTDGTVAIARRFTGKVVSAEWSGFGALKNKALDLATRDWILSLDADE